MRLFGKGLGIRPGDVRPLSPHTAETPREDGLKGLAVTQGSDSGSDSTPPPHGGSGPPPGGYGQPPGGYGQPGGYSGYGKPWAPKPGVIPLRPLSISEMLDGAFTAIKWNPKTILVASAAVAIAVNVLSALAAYLIERSAQPMIVNSGSGAPTFNTHSLVLVVVVLCLDVGVTVLGNTILTGLLTVTVGQAVLGRKETLGSAWRATRGRIWPLLGTVLLAALFIILGWAVAVGVSVGGAVAIAAGAHQTGVGILVGVVGYLAATVFAVITFVRWSLAVPVVMLESSRPLASLGRSWRLVRRSSWRVWWALVLAELIVGIANALIKAPFSVAGGVSTFSLSSQGHPSALGLALSAVGGILGNTLTAPLLAGVVVLLYTDLLMRREGMDIKLQAAAASGSAGYPGTPGPGPVADPTWGGPAGQPGQPGWPISPSGPGTGAPAKPGQPGWATPPSGPGTTGWEDTVGLPEKPRSTGWTGPEDGGNGTGGPDPNAW